MIKEQLTNLGIDVLRDLSTRLLDRFLPSHEIAGSDDAIVAQHIIDKIIETQAARLQPQEITTEDEA